MPTATSALPANTPTNTGVVNCRRRFDSDALRHAMSGPTPVRPSSSKPNGTLTVLKNGGPTGVFDPPNHSLAIRHSVSQSPEDPRPTRKRWFLIEAGSGERHVYRTR